MTASKSLVAHLAAALLGLAALQAGAGESKNEIPITTSSTEAKMDFRAGQAALDRGDGAYANALFRAAIDKDPRFAYAWYNLGNVSFSTEEFADALKQATAVSSHASEGERLLIEINMRFLDNDFERQVALSKQLVEKYPRSRRAWLNLAGVQGGLARYDEQRTSLQKALELDPNFIPTHLAIANSYLFNDPKDMTKSAKHFTAAITLQPGESNYYWGLGDAYRASQKLGQARDYYTRATLLDPHDGIAFVKKGHVNSFLGNYDEARSDYDAGIQAAQPANKPFLANYRTFTWVHAGDANSAVRELEKIYGKVDSMGIPAEQRSGVKVFTLTNAATICLHEDMHDHAARILEQRAEVLRSNARTVGTEDFKQIQEANIAYYDGLLAARGGDYRSAKKAAKHNADLVAAEDNPRKMENYHDLMGLISLKEGNYNKAVEHYRQANLTLMYTKYHLALALDGAGKKGEAQSLFKEVGEWNFNSVGYALVRKDALQRGAS